MAIETKTVVCRCKNRANEVVMGLFTINSKMKNSAKGKSIKVINFTLPAFQTKDGFKTCPNAGVCASGCYARMGAYVWPKVYAKHRANLDATQHALFEQIAGLELSKLKPTHVRIHDSGDFYNADYFLKWCRIADRHSHIQFYAYTKMIELVKFYQGLYQVPKNLTIIFSLGGKQDEMIDQTTDRHSRVFNTEAELLEAGYIDASHDDMLAITPNPKVGLVYHGNKKYDNTAWNKVK